MFVTENALADCIAHALGCEPPIENGSDCGEDNELRTITHASNIVQTNLSDAVRLVTAIKGLVPTLDPDAKRGFMCCGANESFNVLTKVFMRNAFMPKEKVNSILYEDISVSECHERTFEHSLHDENNWDHLIVIHHLIK